jgi:hypothetical protein
MTRSAPAACDRNDNGIALLVIRSSDLLSCLYRGGLIEYAISSVDSQRVRSTPQLQRINEALVILAVLLVSSLKSARLLLRRSIKVMAKQILPLANYGCGMWSCVDCDYLKLPMILWDPNNLHAELDVADARLNWGNSFWDQGRSLRTWLEGWLTEKQESKPKWPSHSWMKKRLGFRLPG